MVCLGRPDGDITQTALVTAAFDRIRPDLVINAAAYTAVDKAEVEEEEAFAVNAEGPARIARQCQARGIPLVHYSSDYVFDGSGDSPRDEDAPINPINAYGRSKAAGEAAIAAEMDAYVTLRTSWIYSRYGQNFLKTMLRLGAERDELKIVNDQVGSPSYAEDIAESTLALSRQILEGHTHFGTFHLTNRGEASWYDFAECIFNWVAARGHSVPVRIPVPSEAFPTPARRPLNSRLNCSCIRQAYGIELPFWTDSVERCLADLANT